MANVFFKKGLLANLPESYSAGTFYVTTDERAMYLDIDDSTRIRLGDFIQVAAVANLPTEGASTSALYYCVAENILAKWNGSEWTQINKQKTLAELGGVSQAAYDEKMTALEQADTDNATAISGVDTRLQAAEEKLKSVATTEGLGELTDRVTTAEGEIDTLQAASHTHTFADSDVEDAIAKKHAHTFTDTDVEDAISKKHAHTFVESELNKIAAGDVAKWNGVVADHLTSADKTAIEDEIGDVNTALENYKTSNNEALAGVKATAEAAATKEYTDAELAKKVAKADYEADKATFATKTELNGVDSKFANYKTAADQKLVDDAQDVEIGKKVDKVTGKSLVDDAEIAKLAGVSEGANKVEASTNGKIKIDGVDTTVYVHPDKHTVSEISDFETKIASYDYATKTEAQGYADAKDEAIEAAQKAGDDAQKAADDLAAYVGTFTASEGVDTVVKYIDAKTANIASDERVNGIDERLTQAEKDIEALETESAKHAIKTEVEGALALKADKSVVDAMYTNAQIDGFIAEAKKYADDNDTDTKYGIVYDSDNKKIKLVEGGSEVEIDASAFIKDGMISNVTIGDDNDLVITFNTDAGKENIVLPLDQLVDIYTGVEGDRIKVTVNADKSISADLVSGSIGKDYLDAGVKASLALADSAIQAHQDISHLATTEALNGVDAKFANYTNTTDMNAKFDLKADKTQVATDIATAKSGAEVEAARLDGVLKAELQGEINTKANAADVYVKTETFTKDEVNAAIAAAVEAAHTWGSF